MQVLNITRNTTLAEEALIANTVFKRMKGLIGRRGFKPGQALILTPCNGVHTFFLHFPIDILFLAKDNTVFKIVPALRPFHLTKIYFKAVSTIELPAGTSSATSTQEGDRISLRD